MVVEMVEVVAHLLLQLQVQPILVVVAEVVDHQVTLLVLQEDQE